MPRLITGDTPTGKLHLGHYVGSLENRLAYQNNPDYDCYFFVANAHAFTTHADKAAFIRESVLDIVLDYLAVGLDPEKSTIFIESDVPAIFEFTTLFSMLTPFARAMRNPTIKDEIRDKGLGDNYPLGFLLYPIIQVADILAFQGDIVPVGEDQVPHLEQAREIARKFNQLYCGVDPHAKDADAQSLGGIFPVPEALIGRVNRLVGTGAPHPDGHLLKMSKSLNNAILLSDDNDTIAKKVMRMYTDPNRLKATDPGRVENNPLWVFHETFNPDKAWVTEYAERYRAGTVGDVPCKKALIEVLVSLIEPMRTRRDVFANDMPEVLRLLKLGAEKANVVADKTLQQAKEAIKQVFGSV